jgi:uncharacterized protein (DUF1697 family)
MKYVAILRGINVGGAKPLNMKKLVEVLQLANFENVVTYIQSGNIVFEYKKLPTDKIALLLTKLIAESFGYDLPIIVLTSEEFKQIAKANPFLQGKAIDFLHVSFLAKAIGDISNINFADKLSKGEEVNVCERAIYLYCPNGYSGCKLTNNFIEAKLKVSATTRNCKTVEAIGKLL